MSPQAAVPEGFVPDGFVPDAPQGFAPDGFEPDDSGATFKTSNDPVQAQLLAQALKLPTNQARAFLQMLGPRGKPALDAFEAQQPGVLGLGWEGIKSAAANSPLALIPQVGSSIATSFAPALAAAQEGNYGTALAQAVRGTAMLPINISGDLTSGLVAGTVDQAKKAYAAGQSLGDSDVNPLRPETWLPKVSTMVGHGLGAVPLVGPAAASIGEAGREYFETGDPRAAARAVGGAAGMVATPYAIEKLPPAVQDIQAKRATRAVTAGEARFLEDLQMAVPDMKSQPWSVEEAQRAAPFLREQHLQKPVTTVKGAVEAADNAIGGIEQKIEGYIKANPNNLIRNNPLDEVRSKLGGHEDNTHLDRGLKSLEKWDLDQPLTLEKADAIRRRLNDENRASMKTADNYDRANMRSTDAAFAAREAAANALRDGIYDQLDARGIKAVANLRQAEGAVMTMRDAFENQTKKAHKRVSEAKPPLARTKNVLSRMGVTGGASIGGTAGFLAGGPIGSGVGATTGAALGAIGSEALGVAALPLTRNALVARAFKGLGAPGARLPMYPTVPSVSIRGLLPPAPGFLGSVPDPSFVRSVPAEAPRPLRGLLGPGPTAFELEQGEGAGGGSFARGIPAGTDYRAYTLEDLLRLGLIKR